MSNSHNQNIDKNSNSNNRLNFSLNNFNFFINNNSNNLNEDELYKAHFNNSDNIISNTVDLSLLSNINNINNNNSDINNNSINNTRNNNDIQIINNNHNINNKNNDNDNKYNSIETILGLNLAALESSGESLNEEQKLRIQFIKNEILFLQNSLKNNKTPTNSYNHQNNTTTLVNNTIINNNNNINKSNNSGNSYNSTSDNSNIINNINNSIQQNIITTSTNTINGSTIINNNSNNNSFINNTPNLNINITSNYNVNNNSNNNNNLSLQMDNIYSNNSYSSNNNDSNSNNNSNYIHNNNNLIYQDEISPISQQQQQPPPLLPQPPTVQLFEENNKNNSNPFTFINGDFTKTQINQIKSIIQTTPKVQGKEWALINQSWYSQWEKGIYSKQELGSIDNYPLLDITDDSNQLLRCDIKEYLDFVAVPIEIWNTLKEVYGGSPDIIRKVTDKGEIDFKIPIILFLIKSSDINQCSQITRCPVFQYETFFSLKKRASQLFNLPFNEFCLFNFDGGIATQELYLFLTPRTLKLYNNQMVLVKERSCQSDSTIDFASSNIPSPSISSLPDVDFKNDTKLFKVNSKTSFTTTNTTSKTTTKTKESNNTDPLIKFEHAEKGFVYYPLYTDPFSLSFLNYSFFKSSFNYDPDSILQSDQYVQFEKMQNNYYSNIDQIQNFSFGISNSNLDKDDKIINDNNKNSSCNNNTNIDNNNNNSNNNNNNNNNDSNNNNNDSNNNKNNKNDTTYFHGIDLEDEDPKKTQRPPKCKVN